MSARAWMTVAALLTSACGSEENPAGPGGRPLSEPTPTLSYAKEVFELSCTFSTCHAGNRPSGSMNLTAERAFGELVGVESKEPGFVRVVPGDPDSSLLAMVLQAPVGKTGRMPDLSPRLDADIIAAIRGWIADGALDN